MGGGGGDGIGGRRSIDVEEYRSKPYLSNFNCTFFTYICPANFGITRNMKVFVASFTLSF